MNESDLPFTLPFACGVCRSAGILTPVVVSSCGHPFCRECLTEYLKLSPTCPTCRSPVNSNNPFVTIQAAVLPTSSSASSTTSPSTTTTSTTTATSSTSATTRTLPSSSTSSAPVLSPSTETYRAFHRDKSSSSSSSSSSKYNTVAVKARLAHRASAISAALEASEADIVALLEELDEKNRVIARLEERVRILENPSPPVNPTSTTRPASPTAPPPSDSVFKRPGFPQRRRLVAPVPVAKRPRIIPSVTPASRRGMSLVMSSRALMAAEVAAATASSASSASSSSSPMYSPIVDPYVNSPSPSARLSAFSKPEARYVPTPPTITTTAAPSSASPSSAPLSVATAPPLSASVPPVPTPPAATTSSAAASANYTAVDVSHSRPTTLAVPTAPANLPSHHHHHHHHAPGFPVPFSVTSLDDSMFSPCPSDSPASGVPPSSSIFAAAAAQEPSPSSTLVKRLDRLARVHTSSSQPDPAYRAGSVVGANTPTQDAFAGSSVSPPDDAPIPAPPDEREEPGQGPVQGHHEDLIATPTGATAGTSNTVPSTPQHRQPSQQQEQLQSASSSQVPL